MSQMLELIRKSEVPSNLMQSAARGSLSVPPDEMIEILVYLAVHHKVFGQQARLTLAGWDEKGSLAAASDPKTSAEVLGYFAALENLRTHLLPALAENPSVSEEALSQLATQGTRSVVEVLMASHRVTKSRELLKALQTNANLRQNELAAIGTRLAAFEAETEEAPDHEEHEEAADAALEEALAKFLKENAAELEAEKEKPFQPIGGIHDEGVSETPVAAAVSAPAGEVKHETAKPAPALPKKPIHAPGDKRDSVLQKISKLDIKGRIGLAMRGSKEERSILIRDGTKLVALAVLDSPKISDGEVEKIALQKNVLESVLRAIPLKRRYAKNYNIMRNLVYNPRTPIDLSLGLMKILLVHDLKNLSANKEVSETIRKLALRMFKQKVEKKG